MCVSVEQEIISGEYHVTITIYDVVPGERIDVSVQGSPIDYTSAVGTVDDMETGLLDAMASAGGPWNSITTDNPSPGIITLVYAEFRGPTTNRSATCGSSSEEEPLVVVTLAPVTFSEGQLRWLRRYQYPEDFFDRIPDTVLYPGWEQRNVWPLNKIVTRLSYHERDLADSYSDYFSDSSSASSVSDSSSSSIAPARCHIVPRVWELIVAWDDPSVSDSESSDSEVPFPLPLIGRFTLHMALGHDNETGNDCIWISMEDEYGYTDYEINNNRSDQNLWTLVVTSDSVRLTASVKYGEAVDEFTWVADNWDCFGPNVFTRVSDTLHPGIVAAVVIPQTLSTKPYGDHVRDALLLTPEEDE